MSFHRSSAENSAHGLMDSLSTKIERAEGRWTVTFFSNGDLVAVSTFDTEDEAVRIACRFLESQETRADHLPRGEE